MSGWLLVLGVGVVIVVVLLAWKKIAALFPASWTGAATNAIAQASDYATDAVTAAAFQTLALAGWANGDRTFLTKRAECRELQKKWGAAEPTPAVVTATVKTTAGETVEVPTTTTA